MGHFMRRFLCLAAALFFWAAFCAAPAHALVSPWQEKPQGSARLIAADNIIPGHLTAGLELKLADGWHAYWRSPGDAGLPPQLKWDASKNLANATFRYPFPKYESLGGINTYSYSGDVVLPLIIDKTDAAQPVTLSAKANILICADICVPVDYQLDLDIPNGPIAADEAADLLKAAYARVPIASDLGVPFVLNGAHIIDDNGKKAIRLDVASVQPLGEVEVIAEVGDGSTLPFTAFRAENGGVIAQLDANAPLADVAGKQLVFTLADHTTNKAVEAPLKLEGGAVSTIMPPPEAAPVTNVETIPVPPENMPHHLSFMILLALLGGLILNLMPCVLPVLALKALSFIQHGGGTKTGVRLSFLATSAGILASFLVMAFILIGIKNAGMSVGWGLQFQHPVFLIGLIAVLLLFAANMWGFFEINLPRFMADKLSWTHGHGSLVKDFFAGAFATLLATPCSAPFLGTAVGFALAGGATEILAIFLALGVGLAGPYLLIAIFPTVATWLPRPGNWMNVLRKVLSVALLATAAWLVWVMVMQLKEEPSVKDAEWQDFDRSGIAALVQQNKTVFVDVTAAWCLTCKANKKFVLEKEDVREALSADGIVRMRADWTKPNEAISQYLKDYGRFGIPFNIIYGPAMPQGYVLPELLTKDAVLDGLHKASGK